MIITLITRLVILLAGAIKMPIKWQVYSINIYLLQVHSINTHLYYTQFAPINLIGFHAIPMSRTCFKKRIRLLL